MLVRTNRVAFSPEDVNKCCSFVSQLCKDAGCMGQGKLCHQAAEVAKKDEEEYLELCRHSCLKCGEERRPAPKTKTSYVA